MDIAIVDVALHKIVRTVLDVLVFVLDALAEAANDDDVVAVHNSSGVFQLKKM